MLGTQAKTNPGGAELPLPAGLAVKGRAWIHVTAFLAY
jgi:hypothetical protein